MKLKRIGVLSLALFQGLLMAILSFTMILIMFIILLIVGSIVSGFMGQGDQNILLMLLPFGLALIIVPIIYGAIGFVMGAIMGALYNLIAKWTGGIELEFEKSTPAVME